MVLSSDNRLVTLFKQEAGHNYVTVMCGVTVGELREFEVKNKVHLPCNVILLEPMYGGVVGAGCHVSVHL